MPNLPLRNGMNWAQKETSRAVEIQSANFKIYYFVRCQVSSKSHKRKREKTDYSASYHDEYEMLPWTFPPLLDIQHPNKNGVSEELLLNVQQPNQTN